MVTSSRAHFSCQIFPMGHIHCAWGRGVLLSQMIIDTDHQFSTAQLIPSCNFYWDFTEGAGKTERNHRKSNFPITFCKSQLIDFGSCPCDSSQAFSLPGCRSLSYLSRPDSIWQKPAYPHHQEFPQDPLKSVSKLWAF